MRMKRKYKKSRVLPLSLFVYTTAMAIYFLPQNTEISQLEKWCTVVASYLIILLLGYVLRKKEQLAAKREQELAEQKQANRLKKEE